MDTGEELFERIAEVNEELLWHGIPDKKAKLSSEIKLFIFGAVICIPFVLLSLSRDNLILQIIFFLPVLLIIGVMLKVLATTLYDFSRYVYLVTNQRIIRRSWTSILDLHYVAQIQFVVVENPMERATDVGFCTGYKVGNTTKIINKKEVTSFDHLLHKDAKEVKKIVEELIKTNSEDV